ncbi:hypothetical protein CASFOL_026522 [Castilleja foliolosa]|uniref:Uncharacterized protein n=1 Tax=Castilleja foliolosa TaxID=1961234 RepID=A0ABD3CHC9_9LAMI
MAFSSSLLLRLIRPKCIIGSSSNHSISGKWSARSSASWSNLRGLSTTSEPVRNQDSSPWLMLSQEFKGGTMNYKFYNLADNKVQTPSLSDEIPNLRLTCRGSSHGWLALLRPHHDDFFPYNPIGRSSILSLGCQ